MATLIKPKKKCCKDAPRCKKCPVVCKRLVTQGLAERRKDGIIVLAPEVTKKQLKAVRKRG